MISSTLVFALTTRIAFLESECKRLLHLCTTDTLTGLYNRRKFEDYLPRALAQAARSAQSVSLLLVDVDHFKQINDTQGHAFGDTVLIQLANKLVRYVRCSDMVFRYGGEEFAVVLTGTPVNEALQVAERLRLVAKDLGFPVSIGVAATSAQGYAELLNAADKALYRAKHLGRDRVCLYEDAQ